MISKYSVEQGDGYTTQSSRKRWRLNKYIYLQHVVGIFNTPGLNTNMEEGSINGEEARVQGTRKLKVSLTRKNPTIRDGESISIDMSKIRRMWSSENPEVPSFRGRGWLPMSSAADRSSQTRPGKGHLDMATQRGAHW